jgi:hypothetical protein
LEGGPGLLAPAGNGRFVALPGTPSGLLQTPADGLEEAADVARVVGDAKLQPNHRGDPDTGPDLPSKAIGFGPAVQEFGQAVQLCGSQATWGTGRRSVTECLRATLAGACQPLADRPLADAERLGDLAL